MKQQQNIKTSESQSEIYSICILKYISTSFGNPVFIFWYIDNDEVETPKLLTYKSREIFAVKSLTNLKAILSSELEDLIVCDNIIYWLENFVLSDLVEYCSYDIQKLENEINKNNLDILTIESFANYINLIDDFVNQDLKNSYLQPYIDNELIKEVWDYFYDFIFWPRFNDKEKFEMWDRPKLEINTNELLVKLKEIIKTFDNCIKPTEKAIC